MKRFFGKLLSSIIMFNVMFSAVTVYAEDLMPAEISDTVESGSSVEMPKKVFSLLGGYEFHNTGKKSSSPTLDIASNASQYKYGEQLSSESKAIYDVLTDQVSPDLPTSETTFNFDDGSSITKDGIEIKINTNKYNISLNSKYDDIYNIVLDAAHAYMYDNADTYWLCRNMAASYSHNPTTGVVASVTIEFYFIDDVSVAKDNIAKYEQWKTNLVNEANKYTTDYQKFKYVHDEICRQTEYGYNEPVTSSVVYAFDTNNEYSHSALGVGLNGKAVCEGYAYALMSVCDALGIECVYQCADNVNSSDSGHAWNLVKIDDVFYYVDITWDDRDNSSKYPTGICYDYFLTGKTFFDSKHSSYVYSNPLNLNISDEAFSYAIGDINNDGSVNGKDIIILRQYLASWNIDFNDRAYMAADMNEDDTVNGKDIITLRQQLAGWTQ